MKAAVAFADLVLSRLQQWVWTKHVRLVSAEVLLPWNCPVIFPTCVHWVSLSALTHFICLVFKKKKKAQTNNERQAIGDAFHSWSANVETTENFKVLLRCLMSRTQFYPDTEHLLSRSVSWQIVCNVFCLSEVFQSTVLNGARGPMVERTAGCRYIPGATIQSEWAKFWDGCKNQTIWNIHEISYFFTSHKCMLPHYVSCYIYFFVYLHMSYPVEFMLWIGLSVLFVCLQTLLVQLANICWF